MRYGTETDLTAIHTKETKTTETLLWENPDRTVSFAAKDVSLTQAVDSFDYLRVIYAYSTSSSEEGFRHVIIPVWNSDKSAYMYQYVSGSDTGYRAALCLRNSEAVTRARTFNIYDDGERMHFYGCQNIGGSTTSNTGCIPVYIYGIKTGGSNDGE